MGLAGRAGSVRAAEPGRVIDDVKATTKQVARESQNRLNKAEYELTTWAARTWLSFSSQKLSVALHRATALEIAHALGISTGADERWVFRCVVEVSEGERWAQEMGVCRSVGLARPALRVCVALSPRRLVVSCRGFKTYFPHLLTFAEACVWRQTGGCCRSGRLAPQGKHGPPHHGDWGQ